MLEKSAFPSSNASIIPKFINYFDNSKSVLNLNFGKLTSTSVAFLSNAGCIKLYNIY